MGQVLEFDCKFPYALSVFVVQSTQVRLLSIFLNIVLACEVMQWRVYVNGWQICLAETECPQRGAFVFDLVTTIINSDSSLVPKFPHILTNALLPYQTL